MMEMLASPDLTFPRFVKSKSWNRVLCSLMVNGTLLSHTLHAMHDPSDRYA